MLRPQPCAWFELVVLRGDLAPALERLAHAGVIELQSVAHAASPWIGADLDAARDRFHALARNHAVFWPKGREGAAEAIEAPAAVFSDALARLEAWRTEAEPLLDRLEQVTQRKRDWTDLSDLLDHASGTIDAGLLATVEDPLAARVFAVPLTEPAFDVPPSVLWVRLAGRACDFIVLVGRSADLATVDHEAATRKARRIALPRSILGVATARRAKRLARLQRAAAVRTAALERELAVLSDRHRLVRALTQLERIDWLVENTRGLGATDRLVQVSGWTTVTDVETFRTLLDRRGIRCVARLAPPPSGLEPPGQLRNPRFVREFERFARLLGQPGYREADPSVFVALFAPLLFGFMFGDVGQGAVLCLAGWMLRRRLPLLALLVPGGIAAMAFGLLFGSVFAREDLLHPLWRSPLQAPVTVLGAALALGVVILLCGLALNGLQAHWRGEARRWWACDAGLVVAYCCTIGGVIGGLIGGVVRPALLGIALAGAAWYVLGAALSAPRDRFAAFGAAVAGLLEHGMQLLVNTLSFARVGAFALAHAGLSTAVVALADAAGPGGHLVVLVLGNVIIVALEGLVVGIQTTRLLLFEFFVRFLEGTGRPFKPLAPPSPLNVSPVMELR